MTTPISPHVNLALDPPDRLTPLAADLLNCLCTTFREAGRPVCRCALYHGDEPPPADECDCECKPGGTGQAWVRIAAVLPSPTSRDNLAGCGLLLVQAHVEVGVYRCISVPDDDGNPPSGSDQTSDALAAYRDAAVLMHIVNCCEQLEDRARLLGWRPIGPAGGCAGSAIMFTVDL